MERSSSLRVFTFDDGLVARGEVYPLNQEEEARRAAELRE
jgi:hypothetical protein